MVSCVSSYSLYDACRFGWGYESVGLTLMGWWDGLHVCNEGAINHWTCFPSQRVIVKQAMRALPWCNAVHHCDVAALSEGEELEQYCKSLST